MWFDCRKEQLSFADRAPIRHCVGARLAAPRSQVFAAIVEPETWPRWFPGVHAASYTGRTPNGIGTIRQAHVGRTHWVEELIAWEADVRWAYTVLRSTAPFAHAQIESFDFGDIDGGTEVRWTLALEPRWLARLGAPFLPRVVDRLFHRAMQNLETFIGNEGRRR
jgi:carbon monoxide dehydrogenase subunit G